MSRVLKPPRLKTGDTIGVVAPASPVQRAVLLKGAHELEQAGYKVRLSPEIEARYRYLAGSHQQRIQEFQSMLDDSEVRAIFCARGGYGSGYLLDEVIPLSGAGAKIILGSSDLTLLLLHFWKKYGWVTFYGPMVAQDLAHGPVAYDLASFNAALQGKAQWVAAQTAKSVRSGSVEGLLLGGCLSLVVATLGTADEIQTEGAILLLEDVDTKPYQVDRMLLQLKRAGKFADVRGIIFGEMPGCMQRPEQGYELSEVIAEVLADFSGPIGYGLPFGHTAGGTLTLPLGVRARLECDTQVRLTVLEAATI